MLDCKCNELRKTQVGQASGQGHWEVSVSKGPWELMEVSELSLQDEMGLHINHPDISLGTHISTFKERIASI